MRTVTSVLGITKKTIDDLKVKVKFILSIEGKLYNKKFKYETSYGCYCFGKDGSKRRFWTDYEEKVGKSSSCGRCKNINSQELIEYCYDDSNLESWIFL